MWPWRKKLAPISNADIPEHPIQLTIEELRIGLESRFWKWFRQQAQIRLRTNRDQLEAPGTLKATDKQFFPSVAEQDWYLKGGCLELRWMIDSPGKVLEQETSTSRED